MAYKPLLLCLFIAFAFNITSAQSTISGRIVDVSGEGIPDVSVFLKDSLSGKTYKHQLSNLQGEFLFEVNKKTTYYLQCSNISYGRVKVPVTLDSDGNEKGIRVVMAEVNYEINEILVVGEYNPITIKDDTVSYNVRHFTDGNEAVVEDILKKLPGVNVNSEGVITVRNKEIDRILIEGDDLLDKGYKILSKNMPSFPIEKVEIINNYVQNALYKGVSMSDKVAINLKLEEKSRSVWFGNIRGGIGTKKSYNLVNNLMNFGKESKTYFLVNLNNIGSILNEHERLSDLKLNNDIVPLFKNQSASELLSFRRENNNYVDRERSLFSTIGMSSLNTIIPLSHKSKLRISGLYNFDSSRSSHKTKEHILVGNDGDINRQSYNSHFREQLGFARVDLNSTLSSISNLSASTFFQYRSTNGASNLTFNDLPSDELSRMREVSFEQLLCVFSKVGDNTILSGSGRYLYEEKPQTYEINRFYFSHLFPELDDVQIVRQRAGDYMHAAEGYITLLHSMGDGQLLAEVGNLYRRDIFRTGLSLLSSEGSEYDPSNYSNHLDYTTNDFSLLSRYNHLFGAVTLSGMVRMHLYSLSLSRKNNHTAPTKGLFFRVDPSIVLKWSINKRNRLTLGYSYKNEVTGVSELYPNKVLTGFRSFRTGLDSPVLPRSSFLSFLYTFGGFADDLMINAIGFYAHNHDALSSYTKYEQNTFTSHSIVTHNGSLLNGNLQLDYFIKPLSSNLKINIGGNRYKYFWAINSGDIQPILSLNYNAGAELRSAFSSVFDFHVGAKISTTKSKSNVETRYITDTEFLDLYFRFNDNLFLKIGSERNGFDKSVSKKAYYFLDFKLEYKVIPNTLKLGLSGSNLIGVDKFVETNVNELINSITEYDLRPRMVMLNCEFRY